MKVDSSERACFVFIVVVLLGIIGVMLLVPVQIAEPLPKVGTAIGTQTVYVHPTEVAEYVDIDTEALILTTYSIIECTLVGETYRPEAFLSIVSEGADLSDFFRTDIYGVTGLKVIINDEVYWLRLWKEE